MSTKTTFKRIALVAVAALGLGVLSVVPSSAVASGTTISATGATLTLRSGSTTAVDSDSTTAAVITVSGLVSSHNDTLSVTFYEKSRPSTSSSQVATMGVLETTTAATYVSEAAVGSALDAAERLSGAATESVTAGNSFQLLANNNSLTSGNIGATFALMLDSTTGTVAGSYVYTIAVTTYSFNGSGSWTQTLTSTDVTITVAANSADSTVPSAAYTAAYIGSSTPTGTADATITPAAATASTTAAAYISVYLKNSSNTAGVAKDTITVTVSGPGLAFDGTSYGKSLTGYQTGTKTYSIVPDGAAGVATITVTTARTAQTWTKSVNFYNAKASSITASNFNPVLKVGSNASSVAASAKDSAGNAFTGTLYVVASSAADALVAGSTTPVQCDAWNSTTGILCPVTALTVGTAKLKVIDASTVAAANATSCSRPRRTHAKSSGLKLTAWHMERSCKTAACWSSSSAATLRLATTVT